jgi:hypothetical protein
MTTLTTPTAVADALVAACEPLFSLIEADPSQLPLGTALIMALLREAQAKQICGVLIIRRIQARLAMVHRIAMGVAALPSMRAPRRG